MKKIKLTKNSLEALNNQLTFDDILYEKFRRLNYELNKRADGLIRNRKKLWCVIKGSPNGLQEIQIVSDIIEGPEGMIVFIK